MEKQYLAITTAIGTFVSFLIDGFGLAVTILLGMMVLDYITGLMSATYKKELSSRVGFRGLMRKAYYLILLGSVYMVGTVVEGISYAGDGLAIALIIMEFISITENGKKMDLNFPPFLQKILNLVKEKEKGDHLK